MKVININSYYVSSSLYYNLETSLMNYELEQITISPILKSLNIRPEAQNKMRDSVYLRRVFSNVDRILFWKKQKKCLKFAEDILEEHAEFDLFHAHSLIINGGLAYKLSLKHDKPFIVAVRSTDINVFLKKSSYFRKKALKYIKKASKIIFISENYLNDFLDIYSDKYTEIIKSKSIVIPNGIDSYWLENQFSEQKTFNGTICFVGSKDKRKNFARLFEAVKDNKEVKEVLYAGAISKSNIKLMNSEEKFKYLGQLNKEQLLNVYRKSSIFCLPSFNETFGLVYLESISQNLPIIYSAGEGFASYVNNHKVGISVDPYNVINIQANVDKMIKNYVKYSSPLQNFNLNDFSWDNIAKKYYNLYSDVYDEKIYK